VLWADLKATASGLRQVRLRDREIGEQLVRRAAVVLAMGGLLAALGTFCLLLTEGTDLLTAAFEAVSALGTVGLSLGLTSGLTAAGKVTVIVLMFVGRLGILTLAYGLVRPGRDRAVRLPRADMMIG